MKKKKNYIKQKVKDQMLVQLSEFKKTKNRKENNSKIRWRVIFKGCILIREIYDDQNKNKYRRDIYLGQLKTNLETDW